MSGFVRCHKITAQWEGGKVDHPRDPGGRTAYGVIQRVYDGWRVKQGLPTQDVYKITQTEVLAIYKQNYWRLIRGDDLPAGVDLVVYDGGVNSGVSRSVKWLQAALNALGYRDLDGKMLDVDGVFADATLHAIKCVKDHDALCAEFCRRRQAFVQSLNTFSTFGKGWTRRISGIRAQSTAWATGSIGTYLPVEAPAPYKATDQSIQKTALTVEKTAGGLGSAGVVYGAAEQTGLADKATEVAQQLEPYVGLSGYIGYAVAALTLFACLYGLYAAYKSRQSARAIKAESTAEVDDYATFLPKSVVMGTKRRKRVSRPGVRVASKARGRGSHKGRNADKRKVSGRKSVSASRS